MTGAKKITRYMVLLLGLVYSSLGNPAFAAEIKVYPDAGPTRYDEIGKPISDCVGTPITPQCALDTWWSCLAEKRIDHCDAIGVGDMVFRPRSSKKKKIGPEIKPIFAFRPIRLVKIEEGDVAPNSRLYKWLRPGDVEIEYQFDSCEGGKPEDCTWQSVGQENLFFKPENGRWLLIVWTSEAGDIVCQDYTAPYGRHCRFWLDNADYSEYVRTIDPERGAGIRSFKRIAPAPLMDLKKP